jgi:serine/threonine protein kinase
VDERNNIKIIDFGFSIDSGAKLNTFCGTPPYMAPEVTLKVLYNGAAADIWSLGVIVYMMTYGKFPFRANN